MNQPRAVQATVGVVAAVLLVLGVIWWRSGGSPDAAPTSAADGPAAEAMGPKRALYFPSTSGMIELEMRATPAEMAPGATKLWLAEQLVAGPESEGLRPALPANAEVESVFAAPDGTVFVDLTIPENASIGMGSTEELLALYSIVNTLVLGDDAAQALVLLVNGRQRDTLAGHLDTSRPLYPRPDLIREPG